MWFHPGGKQRSLSTCEDGGLRRENKSAIEVYLLYFFIIIFDS